MLKHLLFSGMLATSVVGGIALTATPALAAQAPQQNIKVSGQVVDPDGEPLIGATVRVKGSELCGLQRH